MGCLEDYINGLKANRLSDATIKSTYNRLKSLSLYKPLEQITEADLKTWFSTLTCADTTFALYQVVIKKFYKDIGKTEVVEWIKVRQPPETLNEDNVLGVEDVDKMIMVAHSEYWKAYISFLFESGCRYSEAHILKWKDLHDTTDGIIVSIPTTKTKSGYRKIILPRSSQYMRNLKAVSYAKPEDTIFHVKNWQSNRVLKQIAEEAGITKPIHVHSLRHASATHHAKLGMQETLMKKKFGWSAKSPMIARYTHIADTDVIDETLVMNGKAHITHTPKHITEAKPISITDASAIIFKLEEENAALRSEFEKYKIVLDELKKNKVWIGIAPSDISSNK